MAQYRFSRHARNRMRHLHLSDDEVIDAITSGEISEDPKEPGRRQAIKVVRGMRLRVIFREDGELIVVISVHPRRK